MSKRTRLIIFIMAIAVLVLVGDTLLNVVYVRLESVNLNESRPAHDFPPVGRRPQNYILYEKVQDSLLHGNRNKSEKLGVSRTSRVENGNVVKDVYVMIREIHEKIVFKKPTLKPLVFTCNETSIDGNEDLLCMDAPRFLPEFKNPCWYSKTKEFQCLPYFQLIGMGKCASSDLFTRIVQHPDILENAGVRNKETWWWSWRRYGFGFRNKLPRVSFKRYLQYFPSDVIHDSPMKNLITGDGTPMDLSDNSGWPSIPQNNGLSEPRYITAHLIKHLNPHVKLLVILRDPVERVFSDYFFHGVGTMTIEAFLQNLLNSIAIIHNCTRNNSFRTCIYDRDLIISLKPRLHVGFYVIFLQDWFEVFPRKQFLIFKTEEYSSAVADHLSKVFKFLDLRQLSNITMASIANTDRNYQTERKKKAGEMREVSRQILKEFYRPLNEHLAELLHDNRFNW